MLLHFIDERIQRKGLRQEIVSVAFLAYLVANIDSGVQDDGNASGQFISPQSTADGASIFS